MSGVDTFTRGIRPKQPRFRSPSTASCADASTASDGGLGGVVLIHGDVDQYRVPIGRQPAGNQQGLHGQTDGFAWRASATRSTSA